MKEEKFSADNFSSVAGCDDENSLKSTRAFSKRLKEMTQKALEDFILKQNILKKDGNPLKSPEEFEDFLKAALKKESFYKEREAIVNNPDKKDFFLQGEKEIFNYYNNNDVSLEQAFDHYISNNILSIVGNAENRAFEKALEGLNKNLAASPGSLSSDSGNIDMNIENMSERDFERLMKKALRGELKNKF